MDTATLMKLRTRMLKYAQTRKNGRLTAEDIAQTYAMRLLEGLHKKATVQQAYIDIVRLQANSRSKYYEDKLSLISVGSSADVPEEAEVSELSQDETIDLKNILGTITNPKWELIVDLRLKGYTNKEIGCRVGMGEARVSQILQEIVETLQTTIQPIQKL